MGRAWQRCGMPAALLPAVLVGSVSLGNLACEPQRPVASEEVVAVVDLLRKGTQQEQRLALSRLMAMGERAGGAVPNLYVYAYSSDIDGARRAIDALAAIGPDAVPALRRLASRPLHELPRGWLADSFPPDDLPHVGKINEELLWYYNSVAGGACWQAAHLLAKQARQTPRIAPSVFAAIYSWDGSEAGTGMWRTYESIGEVGVPFLLDVLKHGDKRARRIALELLSEMYTGAHDRQAHAATGKLLADPDENVRRAAREAHNRIGVSLPAD